MLDLKGEWLSCKDRFNSYGISEEDLSCWIDVADIERNEITPNRSGSIGKILIKCAVIWAGTPYALIKKSKEQVIGLLCTP